MIIIMGIFLVICAGSCNIYPLYLKKLMDRFNFSLKEVNLYGTFINMGLWIALPMGWIYDTLGPKISCIIGAIFLSGSYTVLYLIINSSIDYISIIPLLIIALIMGQGSALCYTTSVTTNLKNFRFKESSAIVGLLVANLALSPSIFTTYREAMKDVHTAGYFLIIAIFILVIIFICGLVFRNIRRVYNEDLQTKTYEKYKEKKIIKFLILINIIILIVYTFGVIFNSVLDDNGTNKFPLIIIYPCLQLFNFVVVILEYFDFFDKLYFQAFINKRITKQFSSNNNKRIITENVEINLDKKEVTLDEFTEVSLEPSKPALDITDNYMNTINTNNTNSNMDLVGKNDKRESILINDSSKFNNKNNLNNNLNNNLSNNSSQRNINIIDTSSQLNNPDENISFKQAISSQSVIILFIMLVLGIGSMIANLNNIDFIVTSISKQMPYNGVDNKDITANISNLSNMSNGNNTQDSNDLFDNTNTTNTTNTNNNTIISSNSPPIQTDNTSNSNKSHMIYSYVILYFVFNSFTRITSGLILDHLIKIKKVFYYLCFITVFGLLSQIFGLFMNKTLLLISISLAGACHGGYMTFIPVFVRNEYGLKHMGKILGFLTTGCAFGSFIIADILFILSYNYYADNKTSECYGQQCFFASYIITSILLLVNLFLAVILLRNYLKKMRQS